MCIMSIMYIMSIMSKTKEELGKVMINDKEYFQILKASAKEADTSAALIIDKTLS